MTLREMEFLSQKNITQPRGTSYVQDRQNFEEWSIYFDFSDFQKFKKEYPEFLEWLDSPEAHINELLKADAETTKPKVDWDTFVDYHNDVMAFIEITENQVSGLMSMINNDKANENSNHEDNLNKTEAMHYGNINANAAMTKGSS